MRVALQSRPIKTPRGLAPPSSRPTGWALPCRGALLVFALLTAACTDPGAPAPDLCGDARCIEAGVDTQGADAGDRSDAGQSGKPTSTEAAVAQAGDDAGQGSSGPGTDASGPTGRQDAGQAIEAGSAQDASALDARGPDLDASVVEAGQPRDAEPMPRDAAPLVDTALPAVVDPPLPRWSTGCSSWRLNVDVLDSAYSAQLDRVVVLAAYPHALIVIDPRTFAQQTVPLPHLSGELALSRDGRLAVVSHDGFVSVVDLQAARVVKTLPTLTGAGDILTLDGSSASVIGPDNLKCTVNFATEARSCSDMYPYGRSRVVLHPTESLVYAVSPMVSPVRFQTWSIGSTPSIGVPWDIDRYTICPELFMDASGRLYTGCGTVFQTPALTYLTRIPDSIRALADDPAHQRVHMIKQGPGWSLQGKAHADETYFSTRASADLSLQALRTMPCVETPLERARTYGRFLWVSALADRIYTLSLADPAAGLLNNWSLASIAAEPMPNTDAGIDQPPPAPDVPVRPAACGARLLDVNAIGAVYSSAQDRIVLLLEGGTELAVVRPDTGAVQRVALASAAQKVSIGPAGDLVLAFDTRTASVLDVSSAQVLHTIALTGMPSDIAIARDGFGYAFPQLPTVQSVRKIDLRAGVEAESMLPRPRGNIYAIGHPAFPFIYTHDLTSSPQAIEALDVTPADRPRQTVRQPDTDVDGICEPFYFSQDSRRLITSCGTVFRLGPGTPHELAFNGYTGGAPRGFYGLADDGRRGLLYGAPRSGTTLNSGVAPNEAKYSVYVSDGLELKEQRTFPCVQAGDRSLPTYGRYLFLSRSGDRLHVLSVVDAASGITRRWALSTETLAP